MKFYIFSAIFLTLVIGGLYVVIGDFSMPEQSTVNTSPSTMSSDEKEFKDFKIN